MSGFINTVARPDILASSLVIKRLPGPGRDLTLRTLDHLGRWIDKLQANATG